MAARSFGGLGPIIAIAVFGILGVLVIEFGRFREVAVVAGVIPLGIFGGIIALFLTGNSISYTAVIGFRRADRHRDQEFDPARRFHHPAARPRHGIARGDRARRRGSLLARAADQRHRHRRPAAARPVGSGLYSPLAWVIIGGLVSSTLLSRIVTPVMYLLIVRGHLPPEEKKVPATAGA